MQVMPGSTHSPPTVAGGYPPISTARPGGYPIVTTTGGNYGPVQGIDPVDQGLQQGGGQIIEAGDEKELSKCGCIDYVVSSIHNRIIISMPHNK